MKEKINLRLRSCSRTFQVLHRMHWEHVGGGGRGGQHPEEAERPPRGSRGLARRGKGERGFFL